ncbi:MAG: hypothetical protein R3225_09215 [Halofilum sp. (in: g-proteobacteria)]|nr:hypothetical protein [Halofilum sp. (in: g-proteobacteria)]
MPQFRCPSCDQATISGRRKWASSSFAPAVCPNCRAQVYASGKQTSLWRTAEALLVTLVVLLSFASGNSAVLLLIVPIVIAMETLRLFLVPLVRLERAGGGFR